MSVLKAFFDKSVNQCSPIREDYERVVNYDEEGNEFITWSKVDYAKLQKSNGSVSDWNLDVLIKAGIDPKFGIHTGLNTRLEGVGAVEQFAAAADAILAETENKD